MKRKTMLTAAGALIISLSLTVPQVSAFAMSALSAFRVGNTKTITITPEDIEQFATYVEKNREALYLAHNTNFVKEINGMANVELIEFNEPEVKVINNIREFRAFNVDFPEQLRNEQYTAYATDIGKASFKFEDYKVDVAVSPSIAVEYDDVIFAATQGIQIDAESEVKNEIWQKILELPMIPTNIRTQLAAIDPNTNDIYLPVIIGIGREVSMGNTTGYIYSMNDFQSLSGVISEDIMVKIQESEADKNVSVLIWTKNNVLYILAGEKTDGELSKIARSVH